MTAPKNKTKTPFPNERIDALLGDYKKPGVCERAVTDTRFDGEGTTAAVLDATLFNQQHGKIKPSLSKQMHRGTQSVMKTAVSRV